MDLRVKYPDVTTSPLHVDHKPFEASEGIRKAHLEEEAGVCDEAVAEGWEQAGQPAGKQRTLQRQVGLQRAPAQTLPSRSFQEVGRQLHPLCSRQLLRLSGPRIKSIPLLSFKPVFSNHSDATAASQ